MRTTKHLGLAGLVLSLSGGVALADWDGVKSAATTYHNAYEKTYMAYDGEFNGSAMLPGATASCKLTYRYQGFTSGIEIQERTPIPPGGYAEQICAQGEQLSQITASGGISFSGGDLADLLNGFGTNVPAKTGSQGDLETYSVAIPASSIPDLGAMAPDATVTMSLTFDTGSGRLETFGMETSPFPVAGAPGLSMVITGGGGLHYLDDGRPYLGEQTGGAVATDTTGQGNNITSNFVHTATNISIVTPTARVTGTKAPASGFIEVEAKNFKGLLGNPLMERVGDTMVRAAEGISAQSKNLKPALKEAEKEADKE